MISFMRYCDQIFCAFLICVIFLLLSFHQCSILIFQLSAISAISAVMCHYMKYFPFSIWVTWAHHIPFHLITWHGIDPQLEVFPTSGRDSSSGADQVWILTCILKEKFPKSLCGKCDNILCNSLSRGISRRAPYKNDSLVLMRYKTKHKCNVFL